MLTHDALIRLCRARDLLRETHGCRLSIQEVAKEAAASPYHFIRRFTAVFGETPHQFRMQARLDRAKHLLATGDYSVTDVCMEVGFSSLGSFSNLFARRVGRAAVGLPPTGSFPGIGAGSAPEGAGSGVFRPHVRRVRTAVRNFREALGADPVRRGRRLAAGLDARSGCDLTGIESQLPDRHS